MGYGNRDDWEFEFQAGDVAVAAHDRADYHQTRYDFWDAELQQAEHTLREKCVEFRSQEVTGGQRTDVVIDPTLQARVNECRTKMSTHEKQRDQFNAFADALALRPDATLRLKVDDITFFKLGENE